MHSCRMRFHEWERGPYVRLTHGDHFSPGSIGPRKCPSMLHRLAGCDRSATAHGSWLRLSSFALREMSYRACHLADRSVSRLQFESRLLVPI
jgi:hypothetical protein